ncbi:MAG: Pycsar system effector family protein [Saprospiraceae bacterium]
METSTVNNLLTSAEAFVEAYITERVNRKYVFHNFQHTCGVVDAVIEIAAHYELSEQEKTALEIAAWFHDTGYAEGWKNHEVRSAELAVNFLDKKEETESELRERVQRLILCTKMPHEPADLLEQIICDADLSHLGNISYWDRCGRVRQEYALTRDMIMSDQDWINFELNFMLQHEYQTEAARELFGPEKDNHVRQLFKQKKRLFPDQTPSNLNELEEKRRKKKKKKKKKNRPEDDDGETSIRDLNIGRGVETMYRATYRTHVNLSSIADNKANIMLSVNAIIISIVAANLIPKLDNNPHLVGPSIIIVLSCLGSLFFAIQATRPKVTEGKSTREDIDSKKSNLLFFGNFYQMPIEDFHYGMMEMIKDEEFLYSSMTRDLYYLGVVLGKKYRFLSICYNIFLYGLIVAVISFIVAALIYGRGDIN